MYVGAYVRLPDTLSSSTSVWYYAYAYLSHNLSHPLQTLIWDDHNDFYKYTYQLEVGVYVHIRAGRYIKFEDGTVFYKTSWYK